MDNLKEDEELQITDFDPEEEEFNPSSLYTIYKDGFTYPNFTDTLLYGGQMNVIDLYPTSEEETYEKITLLVTKRNFVATGIVYSKNGTIVTYEIGNFTAYNEKETDTTKICI